MQANQRQVFTVAMQAVFPAPFNSLLSVNTIPVFFQMPNVIFSSYATQDFPRVLQNALFGDELVYSLISKLAV